MAHQMLKPYSFLLYFLAILAFFLLGISYAGLIDAGKNQGLAGGAIVLGYGFMGAFLGFLAALFVANKTNRKIIFRLNVILAITVVAFYGYYHLKYLERQNAKMLEKQKIEFPNKPIPTKPAVPQAKIMAMMTINDLKKDNFKQDNVGFLCHKNMYSWTNYRIQ